MHPNPAFHDADAVRNLDFARARGFGMLVVAGNDLPLISHVPFLLDADGRFAELHLVRSNPIARLKDTAMPARIAVSGPDSYVSPDWYGVADQVPTWNYVAVHLTGTLERRPAEEMRAMLDRQSDAYEQRLLPKAPWRTEKMTPEVRDSMMRMIVPYRFHVSAVDGTWKLGQNKPEAVRVAAAEQIAEAGFGSDWQVLARMMRDLDHR